MSLNYPHLDMRTRKKIEEENASRFVNQSVLLLEVLLDIRDVLIKTNKVKRNEGVSKKQLRKHKLECSPSGEPIKDFPCFKKFGLG